MIPDSPFPTAGPLAVLSNRRPAVPDGIAAALLLGAGAGALWGVVARVWMRFISAEHEFTWGGTIAIVVIFGIFGVGQAAAAVVRRPERGQRAWVAGRVFAVATTLPLAMAAGMMMYPFVLLAAVARGRTRMHRLGRLALLGLAAVPTLFVLRQLLEELPDARAVIGWALMFVVYAPLVWAFAPALRPMPASARETASDLRAEAASP
jgi:hypothetical protein